MKKHSLAIWLVLLVLATGLSQLLLAQQESFSYYASKPVGGALKGVVELGASGFNSFVVNIDKQKNWELKKAEFGASIVYEHMASEDDIKSGLKKYILSMIDYGVPGRNIYFVVSSGAVKDSKVQQIIGALRKIGYVVNTVTAESEAEYALKATLPEKYYNDCFVVDIGSSNTKISYVQNSKRVGLETYGSKYYENNIPEDKVYNGVTQVCKEVPKSKIAKCFIIGGTPFELATPVRKGKERYTVLNDPDKYNKLATEKGQKIKAGLNIYKAIQDATGCKQFIFDWDSNFTIGYLLTLK